MMKVIVVLVCAVCFSPVWLKPLHESRVARRNAHEVLKILEQTLISMTSETQGDFQPQESVDLPIDEAPSEWPWINSLLTLYIRTGTPPKTIPKNVLSIIRRHFAINEKFRGLVIRKFATSISFMNFTIQAYPVIKKGLLQLFMTSEEFRSSILQDSSCSEVGPLLKSFVSSMPTKSSNTAIEEFSQEEQFAWKVLVKWSENACFKRVLVGGLLTFETFEDHLEDFLSHSEALSESIVLTFIGSEYFVSSLIREYTKSNHLKNKLVHQYKATKIFRDFLLDTLSNDETFRQTVFDYLSKVELDTNTTGLDIKLALLKQVIQSTPFRAAIFKEIQSDPEFKEVILETFSNNQHFVYAMVTHFARSDGFREEVRDSQVMLDDAMLLFKESESFRNMVLSIETAHVKM